MPTQRLTMRRIRQMLRMHFGAEASDRTIARELGVARSTIRDYLDRAKAAGLSWPLPDELSDEVLEERLFARAGSKPGLRRRAEPDWAALVREMKRPSVTLMVLWEEHRASHPDGYGYSRFCELYRDFEHRLAPTMRQHHVAGDKLFVDYSGKTIDIVDPITGEMRTAEIFVAVLGASNYTYAEASWTQGLADWIGAHVRLFRFCGGLPRLVIPDNLKSAVNRASFYDPEVNRTYGAMAAHYGVGILPARPYSAYDISVEGRVAAAGGKVGLLAWTLCQGKQKFPGRYISTYPPPVSQAYRGGGCGGPQALVSTAAARDPAPPCHPWCGYGGAPPLAAGPAKACSPACPGAVALDLDGVGDPDRWAARVILTGRTLRLSPGAPVRPPAQVPHPARPEADRTA
jgi:transposase